MDLNFGHGFIPRVGEENYKAVDRCVGPADLFTETQLDLPWAIVDGAWAASRPELLDTLRQHGTNTLVDTHSWRYRYAPTLTVAKLATTSWAPTAPLAMTDRANARPLSRQASGPRRRSAPPRASCRDGCPTLRPTIFELAMS